jgi:hypothetical protein
LEEDDLKEEELVVDMNRIYNKIREGSNETCKNMLGYKEIKRNER